MRLAIPQHPHRSIALHFIYIHRHHRVYVIANIGSGPPPTLLNRWYPAIRELISQHILDSPLPVHEPVPSKIVVEPSDIFSVGEVHIGITVIEIHQIIRSGRADPHLSAQTFELLDYLVIEEPSALPYTQTPPVPTTNALTGSRRGRNRRKPFAPQGLRQESE